MRCCSNLFSRIIISALNQPSMRLSAFANATKYSSFGRNQSQIWGKRDFTFADSFSLNNLYAAPSRNFALQRRVWERWSTPTTPKITRGMKTSSTVPTDDARKPRQWHGRRACVLCRAFFCRCRNWHYSCSFVSASAINSSFLVGILPSFPICLSL